MCFEMPTSGLSISLSFTYGPLASNGKMPKRNHLEVAPLLRQEDLVKMALIWKMLDLSDVFCATEKKCVKRQDEKTFIPDYLLAEIENSVIKELTLRLQVPEETADNKKNINR